MHDVITQSVKIDYTESKFNKASACEQIITKWLTLLSQVDRIMKTQKMHEQLIAPGPLLVATVLTTPSAMWC